MKKEDNKIIFVDDKGQKTTLNILFTYKNDKRNIVFNSFFIIFLSFHRNFQAFLSVFDIFRHDKKYSPIIRIFPFS